jgi:2,5-dioxopentanoate dehydrogenase
MELTGQSFIASKRGAGAPAFYGVNPLTGAQLEPGYAEATPDEIARALALAAEAAAPYAAISGRERAAFLRRIADNLDAAVDQLVASAHEESGLSLPRLTGETARTTGQLRLFATILEEGSWLRARIDTALPDRKPFPRPALRSLQRPLGPVVVFGASNFPLAFSTAGGDTTAALAAGCPVIVKAHPAHPATSEVAAAAIQKAVAEAGLPEGVFSLLYSAGNNLGKTLVLDPRVQAVAFTGSQRGGRALMDLAARRPQPIPCFAEMSSVNPLFILPELLAADPEGFAKNLFASFTLGSGQFCTKPGLIFWTRLPGSDAFLAHLKKLVDEATPLPLLTPGIAKSYQQLTVERATQSTRAAEAKPQAGAPCFHADPQLFSATLAEFEAHPHLAEEIFGPTTLLIECPDLASYVRAANGLEGQLTATLFGTEADLATQRELIAVLATKAGRVIANAFPTGVEVSHAMVHGGPYPAASDARFTSVGTRAIDRFVRPVCYQSLPDALLPAELQDANPLGILRLVDGTETRVPLA